MYSLPQDFDEEEPTIRDAPSAVWVVQVDKASRRIQDVIDTLESGGNPDAILEDLKSAHALVNGRGTR
jgi:hypothetical protein